MGFGGRGGVEGRTPHAAESQPGEQKSNLCRGGFTQLPRGHQRRGPQARMGSPWNPGRGGGTGGSEGRHAGRVHTPLGVRGLTWGPFGVTSRRRYLGATAGGNTEGAGGPGADGGAGTRSREVAHGAEQVPASGVARREATGR